MIKRTATKEAIKGALGVHKATLKTIELTQKDALAALLEAVRDADGSVRKPGVRLDEFDVPEEDDA